MGCTAEALTKYGRDLVADAEAGKLDPVIGRDEEIRRVIQAELGPPGPCPELEPLGDLQRDGF